MKKYHMEKVKFKIGLKNGLIVLVLEGVGV